MHMNYTQVLQYIFQFSPTIVNPIALRCLVSNKRLYILKSALSGLRQ